jgi:hypothetical protein
VTIAGVRLRGALFVAAMLATAGCENSDATLFSTPFDDSPQDAPVSLSRSVQPILTARCATAGCHAGPLPASDLVLEPGRLFDAGVGAVGVTSLEAAPALRIAPGDSAASYLVHKLTGDGIAGDRMPPGDPLPQVEVDSIRKWIDEGARNN